MLLLSMAKADPIRFQQNSVWLMVILHFSVFGEFSSILSIRIRTHIRLCLRPKRHSTSIFITNKAISISYRNFFILWMIWRGFSSSRVGKWKKKEENIVHVYAVRFITISNNSVWGAKIGKILQNIRFSKFVSSFFSIQYSLALLLFDAPFDILPQLIEYSFRRDRIVFAMQCNGEAHVRGS